MSAATLFITRLEEAAKGSRELDRTIWHELDLPGGLNGTIWVGPPVTTSIDVALALAERVLGRLTGWRVEVAGRVCWAKVVYAEGTEEQTANAATPALALCIATLKANHKDKP